LLKNIDETNVRCLCLLWMWMQEEMNKEKKQFCSELILLFDLTSFYLFIYLLQIYFKACIGMHLIAVIYYELKNTLIA
jgi:hypothetical protein